MYSSRDDMSEIVTNTDLVDAFMRVGIEIKSVRWEQTGMIVITTATGIDLPALEKAAMWAFFDTPYKCLDLQLRHKSRDFNTLASRFAFALSEKSADEIEFDNFMRLMYSISVLSKYGIEPNPNVGNTFLDHQIVSLPRVIALNWTANLIPGEHFNIAGSEHVILDFYEDMFYVLRIDPFDYVFPFSKYEADNDYYYRYLNVDTVVEAESKNNQSVFGNRKYFISLTDAFSDRICGFVKDSEDNGSVVLIFEHIDFENGILPQLYTKRVSKNAQLYILEENQMYRFSSVQTVISRTKSQVTISLTIGVNEPDTFNANIVKDNDGKINVLFTVKKVSGSLQELNQTTNIVNAANEYVNAAISLIEAL